LPLVWFGSTLSPVLDNRLRKWATVDKIIKATCVFSRYVPKYNKKKKPQVKLLLKSLQIQIIIFILTAVSAI
jgi:hypothetical protein